MTIEELRERGIIPLTIPESVGELANMLQDFKVAGKRAERERCARIAEAMGISEGRYGDPLEFSERIAAAIRKGA